MLTVFIKDAKKGDDFIFFATSRTGYDKEIQKFFLNYDIKRKEKGLRVRGVALKELKELFEGRKFIKMKYPKFPIPSDISTCNEKVAIISWGEKPVGYLIKSKNISEMYKEYFERVWNIAK